MHNTNPASHRVTMATSEHQGRVKVLSQKNGKKIESQTISADSVPRENVGRMSSETRSAAQAVHSGLQGSELHPSLKCSMQRRLMNIFLSHSACIILKLDFTAKKIFTFPIPPLPGGFK